MNQFKIMHIVWYNLLLILHSLDWKDVENPDYLEVPNSARKMKMSISDSAEGLYG